MGVTTSFFSASRDELAAAAPGRPRPEYGPCEDVEMRNPFTGTVMATRQTRLLTEAPSDAPPDTVHALIPRGRGDWKLTGLELPLLMNVLLDAHDDETKVLGQQAVLGPDDDEWWVFEMPQRLVDALAALTPERTAAVESGWQAALEWSAPPKVLLKHLVEVAREAVAAGKPLFQYVSL